MKTLCRGSSVLLLLLTAFPLVPADVDLHGNSKMTGGLSDLRCWTDYLFTVNCSLIINKSSTETPLSAYWLVFQERDYNETCLVSSARTYHVCSFTAYDSFTLYNYDDIDSIAAFSGEDCFKISLCCNASDGSQSCEVLDSSFIPANNIMPKPPYCLTVNYSTNQYNFSWQSPYKEFPDLTYELLYYRQGQEKNATTVYIDTVKYFSVADKHFVPDVENTVKVRSSPTGSYLGQWSNWSPEVHWKTEPALLSQPTIPDVFIPDKTMIIPLSVLGLLVLILSYYSFVKLRQNVFIPTPEPYFHSLYRDCQGDFKIWVSAASHLTEVLKTEETLPIDSLVKSTEDLEERGTAAPCQETSEGGTRHIASNWAYCGTFIGVPYAVTSVPLLPVGLTASAESGSTVKADSGCWILRESSLERDTPWYTNEYCTLSNTMSALQMTCSASAEYQGSAINKVNRDYQNDFQ